MKSLPDAFASMAEYKQFILYKLSPSSTRPGKTDKFPCDFTGAVKSAHDPAIWLDAQTAIDTAAAYGPEYGVGFTFTLADPFFFVDLDDCLQPDGVSWSPVALDLIARLPGAAVEVSQSGKGLHIIGQGAAIDHSCKNIPLGLEFYTDGRFVALTGTNIIGSSGAVCDLSNVVADYFPPKGSTKGQDWTTAPVTEWNGYTDDAELIAKACASKSASAAFGAATGFAALWAGDETALADAYPDENRAYDASSADAGLAQHLAFWTGNDCARILSIMKKSGLVRDKWKRDDYLIRTITRAVSLQTTVYTAGRTSVEPQKNLHRTDPEVMDGFQFLGANQQIEHFKGCVYIQDMHRVFTPSGTILKAEQFNATYGGYVFQLDSDTGGKTNRKAWEVFTESQLVRFPKAESMCFRPGMEQGVLIKEEGRLLVNTYVHIDTPRVQGDASPFLKHLALVLPDKRDQSILLAYMAACIQHKGVKFQWTPLLQGCEGNGKTLFTRCVAAAIGKRYTHYPKAMDIDNKFNGWLINKLFIGVEDIYVPDNRREVIETLKPMITGGDGLEIQLKGVDQITADICANFMLNSNHKDAIKKTKSDRRFCVFYTAQQSVKDVVRDGMGGDYFPKLYDWLKKENGYAIVADYLERYEIPNELNPAGACHRAPDTSSTSEVIRVSLGGIEQEVLEAIDEGRQGFAGGWISSMAFEKLLEQRRASRAIPPNKRRELLQSLGYDWHPSLKNGRVNNIILIDCGKPRLFIKEGHISINLESVAAVVDAYQLAQGGISSNISIDAPVNTA